MSEQAAGGAVAGPPEISAERYVEQGNVVVVLGRVRAPLPDGGFFHGAFSDVFTFRDGRACVVESYVVPLADAQYRDFPGPIDEPTGASGRNT